jgi:hypothetical protein
MSVCPSLFFISKAVQHISMLVGLNHQFTFTLIDPVQLKMTAFWDMALCSLVEIYRRSWSAYGLHQVRTSETSVYFNETTRRYTRSILSSYLLPWDLEISQNIINSYIPSSSNNMLPFSSSSNHKSQCSGKHTYCGFGSLHFEYLLSWTVSWFFSVPQWSMSTI